MAYDEQTKEKLNFLAENNDSEEVVYPYTKIKHSKIGHRLEFSESEGNEFVLVKHGLTGSYIKMFATGDIQIHSPARDINVVAARHVNVKAGTKVDKESKDASDRMVVHVVGNAHMEVEGDMHCHVKGNRYDTVDGEYILNVKDKFVQTISEGGIKCSGTYTMDSNKFVTDGSNIQRNLKAGGIMRDSFAGTYIIEQTNPGGNLTLKSMGDIDIDALGHIRVKTLSNLTHTIGGKVEYAIAGLRVIGTPTGLPTGPLTPFESSFDVTCAAGAIRHTAALGVMQLFAGGPYLDVDCLTGVYLN